MIPEQKSFLMYVKILLCITWINYIFKYIQIENNFKFQIVVLFHYYSFYGIFDQINAALVTK